MVNAPGTLRSKGRLPSLLAWGLLVGGVAILMTFPDGAPPDGLAPGQVPAAILFFLAGLVFGLSHPEGRAWIGALLLGWLPIVTGLVILLGEGPAAPIAVWILLLALPAVLAAAGSWIGARLALRRTTRA